MTYTPKEYIPGAAVTQAQQALEDQKQKKPGDYQSQLQGKLQDLLGQIQNRPAFRYDIGEDALWNQFKDQYVRQGRQAMMDTMGQTSALTGGYGNSYAQSVGQQTYGAYLQALNDRVPEFYSLALDRYRAEGEDLLSRYGLLQQQETQDYGRYQDSLDRYYAELNRLQGIYDTQREFDFGQWAQSQDFAYSQHRDQVADEKWQAEQEARKNQNQRAYDQWLQEFEYQKQQDDRAYQQWLQEFQEDQRRYEQQLTAAQSKSSGGRSGGSYGAEETLTEDTEKARTFVDNMLGSASSSRFDPERVISGTSALNAAQKEEAQKYLKLLLADGRMK